eukprot:scaffold1.g5783.t1
MTAEQEALLDAHLHGREGQQEQDLAAQAQTPGQQQLDPRRLRGGARMPRGGPEDARAFGVSDVPSNNFPRSQPPEQTQWDGEGPDFNMSDVEREGEARLGRWDEAQPDYGSSDTERWAVSAVPGAKRASGRGAGPPLTHPQTQWDGEGPDYTMADVEREHEHSELTSHSQWDGEGPDYDMADVTHECHCARLKKEACRPDAAPQWDGEGPGEAKERCAAEAARARAAAAADLAAPRAEYLFAPPALVAAALRGLLADPRDQPIANLIFNLLVVTLPSAALLYAARPASNWPGALYLGANYALFLQRFMLTLHFSEHRRLFRKGWGALNQLVPFVLAPFFGVPSGMYRLHHCVMHHVENNGAGRDLSSTEPYQRDNPLHFAWYWLRFAVGSWVELPWYAARARRWGALAACLAGEGTYLGGVAWLYRLSPMATKWVIVIPFCVSSFALMFGNWSQHVFIDPAGPGSSYRLTYNCLACPDNARTYNDGYHVVHHLNSQLHWSELPAKFADCLEQHAAEGALAFVGIGFFDVGLAVFMRNYRLLVDRLVKCSEPLAAMSDAELAAMLRTRLAPVRR